jgi:cytochrome b561
MSRMESHDDARGATYSAGARHFHWITAAAVFVMVPVGIYMTNRAAATNFDALTGTLYSWHKLGGFIVLWIILARLAYRIGKGAPPDEPTIEPWQKTVAHLTHWSIYALLVAVPLLGWYATSLYGALGTPLGFSLPAIAAKNEAASETVYMLHKGGAIVLTLLALMHIGAGLYHHIIRKDNVLRRMLPGLKQR